MVRLNVALVASSARAAQDLLDALRFLVMTLRLEEGCLGSCAWVNPDWTVQCVVEWATDDHIRKWMRSDRFTSLLSLIESAREPRVQFDFVTTSRGLDFVEEVRGQPQ